MKSSVLFIPPLALPFSPLRLFPLRLLLPCAFADAGAQLADGFGESGEDGVRDDVVADVEFDDLGDGGDRRDVAVGEAVAGGDVQPGARGERGGGAQPFEFFGGAGAPFEEL